MEFWIGFFKKNLKIMTTPRVRIILSFQSIVFFSWFKYLKIKQFVSINEKNDKKTIEEKCRIQFCKNNPKIEIPFSHIPNKIFQWKLL